MIDEAMLGLPLALALERLAAAGETVLRVERTLAPRRGPEEGELRVVRLRRETGGLVLDVCLFVHTVQ